MSWNVLCSRASCFTCLAHTSNGIAHKNDANNMLDAINNCSPMQTNTRVIIQQIITYLNTDGFAIHCLNESLK